MDKKYCKNCIHFELEEVIVGRREDRCTYIIKESPYEDFLNRKYSMQRHPIPSINNANHDCPYYEESFLTRTLRRFKR